MSKRVVTVGRHGTRIAKKRNWNFPVFAVKVYEYRARKSDGVSTARLVETLEETATSCHGEPSETLLETAREIARERGLPFTPGVVQGDIDPDERVCGSAAA
jgi:hypothetical protein